MTSMRIALLVQSVGDGTTPLTDDANYYIRPYPTFYISTYDSRQQPGSMDLQVLNNDLVYIL